MRSSTKWMWLLATASLLLWLAYTARTVWLEEPWNQSNHGLDTSVYYLGGQLWLDGESAYDRARFKDYYEGLNRSEMGLERAVFVSPPTIAPIACFIGLFRWPVAVRWVDALQLTCWLMIVAICLSWTRDSGPIRWPYALFCVAVAGCLGGVNATMLFGQMGLYALAGSLGAIYAVQRGHTALFVAMIYLASIKAQISLLPLLYALALGSLVPFLIAGGLSVATLVAVEWTPELTHFVQRYRGSMAAYAEHTFNAELANRIGLAGLWGHTSAGGTAFAISSCVVVVSALFLGVRARGRRRSGRYTRAQISQLESLDVFMLALLGPVGLPTFTYDFLGPAVCLLLSALLPSLRERVALFALVLASTKLHGMEEKLIHAHTPLLGWLDGHVAHVFTAVTCLGGCILAARRQAQIVADGAPPAASLVAADTHASAPNSLHPS